VLDRGSNLNQSGSFDALAIEMVLDDPMTIYGALDNTHAGGSNGGILYSGAGGVAGLLAQVAVHSAIAGNKQNAAQKKAQEEANRVLIDFEGVIGNKTNELLWQAYASQSNVIDETLFLAGQDSDQDVLLQVRPLYYLLQDSSAMYLDLHVRAYNQSYPKKTLYENMVRAISAPFENIAETEHVLNSASGEYFDTMVQELFNRSLNTAVLDIRSDNEDYIGEERTYKYKLGQKNRFVRGVALEENCNTKIVRNLRGNLLVIPVNSDDRCLDGTDSGALLVN